MGTEELGLPDWSLFSWSKPYRLCGHKRLEFGCKKCILFERDSRIYNALKAIKYPHCGDCGKKMFPHDFNFDKGDLEISFSCPEDGEMCCDEDKAETVIRI